MPNCPWFKKCASPTTLPIFYDIKKCFANNLFRFIPYCKSFPLNEYVNSENREMNHRWESDISCLLPRINYHLIPNDRAVFTYVLVPKIMGGKKAAVLVPHLPRHRWWALDLKFVKKFTRPNFQAKEFYTLKTRKLRLFSPAINSENASLSVIWPSFG